MEDETNEEIVSSLKYLDNCCSKYGGFQDDVKMRVGDGIKTSDAMKMTWMDRWRNREVRRKVGVRERISGRVDRKVLKWFGHVERMSGERLPPYNTCLPKQIRYIPMVFH